jgi:hypothetical protein
MTLGASNPLNICSTCLIRCIRVLLTWYLAFCSDNNHYLKQESHKWTHIRNENGSLRTKFQNLLAKYVKQIILSQIIKFGKRNQKVSLVDFLY